MQINTTLFGDDLKEMIQADLLQRFKVEVSKSDINIRVIRSERSEDDYVVIHVDVDTSR